MSQMIKAVKLTENKTKDVSEDEIIAIAKRYLEKVSG